MNYDNLVVYLVCFIPALCYAVFYTSRRRLYELAALIPGIPGLPLIGNALQFSGSTLDFTKTMKKLTTSCMQHDGIIKFWLGPLLYIGLINPRDVEIVLSKELNKDPIYRFFKPWLGNGLISGDLSVWKLHRKMLLPTFHQTILDNFLDVFVEKSKIMATKMSKTKGTFNATDFLKPCALDIICETAMGVKINAQENMDTPYIQAAIGLLEIINTRFFKWWFQAEWVYKWTHYAKQEKAYLKTLHDFTDNVIQMKKKTKHNNIQKTKDGNFQTGRMSKRVAFLDLLLELSDEDHQWTDEEMREEVDTMMTAGTDTTSQTICYALLLLGSHPHIQDMVFEELHTIFGDSNRSITKEDLSRMEYMERVIKESLRLFPGGPLILRQLKQEVKLENYTLPANTGCVIGIYAIHRDPKIWGDKADDCDPDNFLPEKCAKRHPCSFIPFSAGPRNCIGRQFAMMSGKVMLATILRSFKVHSAIDHKEVWRKDIVFEIFTRPLGGFPISVEPRLNILSSN